MESSVWGIQTGVIGAWVHHETRLANQTALRSEVGLNTVIFGGSFYDGVVTAFIPVLTLEPRWYYNAEKRRLKNKNTSGNASNFLSINSSFHPDWFVISDGDNLRVLNQISFVPTWGVRRNIGTALNWEAGIGIGVRHIFAKSAGYLEDKTEAALNFHLRIGYKF